MTQTGAQNSENLDPAAAVALILVQNPTPEFIIIERAKHPKDPWSGHLALPGGRKNSGDKSLLDTCIRETREEIGVFLKEENLKARLPHSTAGSKIKSNMLVSPFVFILKEKPALNPDPGEVTKAFWVSQELLLNSKNHRFQQTLKQMPHLKFPSINIEEKLLWGFTYGVFARYFDVNNIPHPFLRMPNS